MRIVVVGNGLLGSTLRDAVTDGCCDFACYQDSGCACVGCSTTILGHADIDITSRDSITQALRKHKPDVVINTAAYHNLQKCEDNPDLAFEVNAAGAKLLASMAPTVYISTDYVFWDGGPHDEALPGQQPHSIYGRSKLAGEMGTLEHGGIVVRVSALYGHYPSHKGPSFPQMIVSSHDPIRLPYDQTFSPTYAPDAADRILALAIDPKSEGIYHAANRGYTTWAGFAEHILGLTRHDRHVLPYQAHDKLRPRNSSLKSSRLPALPFWADGLGRWARREEHVQFVSPKRSE